MDTTVRAATTTDLADVADVLTAAFFDDPLMAWAFDDAVRERRLHAMWSFFGARAYLPAGASTVLPGGDGAALWLPPGTELGDEFWAEHGEGFVTALEGDLARLSALGEAMAAHHPHDDHWYLLAIGATPAAQGRGVGSALLAHTLALADERGEPAYLEATSPRSRVLYARFGFEVQAEFNALDGPPVWAMWRPPQPRSDGG